MDRVFHAEPVQGFGNSDQSNQKNSFVKINRYKFSKQTCFYPSNLLRPINWDNTICVSPEKFKKIKLHPLKNLLVEGSKVDKFKPAGGSYPTFYNVAYEGFYNTTDKSEKLFEVGSGKLISAVSANYRVDLDVQGTGQLLDGRVINVAQRKNGVWNYKIMPKGSYGEGIFSHELLPFRAVALDFVQLCKQAKLDFCNQDESVVKEKLVGSLLYIPKLKNIKLPDGSIHDGYVCAQDIGGAIKEERIDLFVGPMGAGNPYVPECRSNNAFISAGIESVVPYDWRTYVADGAGTDGLPKFKRVNPEEYKVYASSKKLEIFLVQNAKCKARF